MSPKMKTRKSISDRFRVTKKGKVLYKSNFNSHLKSAKSKSQLRRLKRVKKLEKGLAKKVKQLIPK